MAQHADTQAPDVARQRRPIIRYGASIARGIFYVMTREDLHDDGTILDRPGQRARMVVGEGIRHDATAADQAIGRFQPDSAAQRGGNANGAAGIGAKCRGHQAGSDAGGGPA